MDIQLKEDFVQLWKKFFNEAELPIIFFFDKGDGGADYAPVPKGHSCIIAELGKVRKGKSLYYNRENLGCGGARRYFGFATEMMPTFRYFLSCGLEGKVAGERYKQTPEIVDEMQKMQVELPAEGRNIVFKRWDNIDAEDNPEAVIFFADADVISGLFTLANFDRIDPNGGVITPFGAGCGSIVHYPYLEMKQEKPRGVIGLFDPSARKLIKSEILSFAVPYNRFTQLIGYMEESFLITDTWKSVQKRI